MDGQNERAARTTRKRASRRAVIPWLLAGVALFCAGAHGGSDVLTLPARQFSRGDVEEQKDGYGDFIVVRSVVAYDLGVAGVEQLSLEIQGAGDAALQVWQTESFTTKQPWPCPRPAWVYTTSRCGSP